MKLSLLATLTLIFCVDVSAQSDSKSNWATFRGPDRTGVAPDTGLMTQWPAEGPKLLWTTEGAGQGYASVSIADGKMYTLGDHLSGDDDNEYLTCFDQSTGEFVWKFQTGDPWTKGKTSWQSSRSTPTVDADRVYVITPSGTLWCVSTGGKENWKVDLTKKFGGKKAEMWGYSESVLIDGDNLICTPGGSKNTMVALDKMTGEKVWSCSRKGDRGAGHASIVISQAGDTKVYVQTTGSGALGVRASDGELMWTYEIDKTTAVIPTPIVRDDLVFFSAGYGRGGALLRQIPGEKVTVEEVYGLNPKLNNKHGGIVLIGDYLYGDTNDKGTPFCADLMTGEIKWKSRGSGKKSACVTAADDHLFFLYANATMTLVKADPSSFQEVGSFKVPGDTDRPSWAHPVIADGKLYLRQGSNIHCYALK